MPLTSATSRSAPGLASPASEARSEPRRQLRQPDRRRIDEGCLGPLVEAGEDEQAGRDERRAHQRLRKRRGTARRSRQRRSAVRDRAPSPRRGSAAPMPSIRHRGGDRTEARRASGRDRRGPERRTRAGAPHRPEQGPDTELPGPAACRDPAETTLRPVSERGRRHGEGRLQSRRDEHEIDRRQQCGRDRSQDVGVEPDRGAQRGDERADQPERECEPPARSGRPKRCPEDAEPSTIGRMGSTQGDSVESIPARVAKASVAIKAGTLSRQAGSPGSDRLRSTCRADPLWTHLKFGIWTASRTSAAAAGD